MKKVAVVGSSGRMGQEILSVLKEKAITVTEVSKETQGISAKSLSGNSLVIDFSSPEGFSKSLQACVQLGIPFVSGTTGLSAEQKKKLQLAAKKIPVVWSPNMSLGVAVLKKAIRLFAHLEDFDFQIEEFHHNKKKDRPSGTALALQQELKDVLSEKRKKQVPDPLVVRAGGIFGIHKAYAVSDEELLCFEHQALNRRVFATGAVRVGLWLMKQKPGLYQVEDIF
jgi:4-hydroxy-tetrahydrodipicolinate reductase